MSECRVLDEGRVHLYCGICPYQDSCQYFQQLPEVIERDDDSDADLDQCDPVDCSAETWLEIYAKNPDLLY